MFFFLKILKQNSRSLIHGYSGKPKFLLLLSILLDSLAFVSKSNEVLSIISLKNTVLTNEDYTYSTEYQCSGIVGNRNNQSKIFLLPQEIANSIILCGDIFISNSNYVLACVPHSNKVSEKVF